jgi:hypothetical protein
MSPHVPWPLKAGTASQHEAGTAPEHKAGRGKRNRSPDLGQGEGPHKAPPRPQTVAIG